MPTFPLTVAGTERRRSFLEKRRSEYRAGRRLGLKPRTAGHLYSEKQATPKLLETSYKKPDVPSREQTTRYTDYVFRNTATDYIKARVYIRGVQSGTKKVLNWTFTSRRGQLTHGAMLSAVEAQLQRKAENYGEEPVEVEGISFVEEITYPSGPGRIPETITTPRTR